MATTVPVSLKVSLKEYLLGDYRPDVDFVDGELEERNVGEDDHSALQRALIYYFQPRRTEWNVRVVQEVRMRISETRYRVPDVCLTSLEFPREQIITRPPLAVIEILSPKDRFRSFEERVGDYFEMGVPHIWIFDPHKKIGYNCTSPGFEDWKPQAHFTVEGTPIEIELADVLREID